MSGLALILSLGSAVFWSFANLAIGPAARRAGAWTAAAAAAAIGCVLMAAVAAAFEGLPGALDAAGAWRLAAAVGAALLAYGGLYLAFGHGKVAVVAPIVSAWCVISTAIGLVQGERISLLGVAGVAAVMLGNALLAGAPPREGEQRRGGVVPACVSAVGFGLMAPLVGDLGADLGRLWTPAAIWGGTLLIGVPLLLATGLLRRIPLTGANLRALALPAALESAGFASLSLALGYGALVEVTPVSSLSTGLSVLWGLLLLRERLRKRAILGAAAASIGVVLVQL